ncbi:hypothetical protein QOZ80_3AG0238720 [Eleusine coracana subsp. coracana]|nr:hypothetical protein QOZ80_3AG0238720 [Eleusine coracana subsp. coracana]
MAMRVGGLWADESFRAIPELPRSTPVCPVLSPEEPDTVYFFLSDLGCVDGHVVIKGVYVLELNMRSKKVQSWSKYPPGRRFERFPGFLATATAA